MSIRTPFNPMGTLVAPWELPSGFPLKDAVVTGFLNGYFLNVPEKATLGGGGFKSDASNEDFFPKVKALLVGALEETQDFYEFSLINGGSRKYCYIFRLTNNGLLGFTNGNMQDGEYQFRPSNASRVYYCQFESPLFLADEVDINFYRNASASLGNRPPFFVTQKAWALALNRNITAQERTLLAEAMSKIAKP